MSKPGIIAAAVLSKDGEVYHLLPPARHHNILHFFGKGIDGTQGFLTSDGTFVDRSSALEIARNAGQLKPRLLGQYNGPELFSEDLW